MKLSGDRWMKSRDHNELPPTIFAQQRYIVAQYTVHCCPVLGKPLPLMPVATFTLPPSIQFHPLKQPPHVPHPLQVL